MGLEPNLYGNQWELMGVPLNGKLPAMPPHSLFLSPDHPQSIPVWSLDTTVSVGRLGMIDATIETHADYVQSWIKVLKKDKKAIFTAASQAAKASDFILNQASNKAIH
jgi:hypothetical protein